jgi:hypothetical protein
LVVFEGKEVGEKRKERKAYEDKHSALVVCFMAYSVLLKWFAVDRYIDGLKCSLSISLSCRFVVRF